MPVTASYSAATRKLNVLGDALANSIILSRNLAGTIFVNGGAVAVSGGLPTVTNTDLIEAFGLDLNDVITLDQTNGALPAAMLSGGNGDDILTGGSNADTLNGDAGLDTLNGQGGADQLFGGNENDVLTGGDAKDTMDGGAGNDRMIWNSGDDNDVMEGGADSDIAEINGDNGAETFQIAPDGTGTRVLFQRLGPTPFSIDIGTTETLVLNANGGDDIINALGNLSPLIALTLDGGTGNDTINGGNGADTLIGSDGNDTIDGNQGPDFALLGLGNDVFKWDPGDGSDIVEGQADSDQLLFNGSNASENIDISVNPGSRVRFFRDVGAITMDLNDVETIRYNALAGADNIALADMTGTDLVSLVIDLGASAGGADGQADRVTVTGNTLSDSIAVTSASGITVAGLFTNVLIEDAEAIDRLVIAAGTGNDTVNASGIAPGQIIVELQGGLGTDVLVGSDGGDFLFGGDGNDTALMGGGDDTFTWSPGDDNDVLEGQAGTDTMEFNGAAAAEAISISPNGGRASFLRDVAAVAMDLNDVERIVFHALGGIDNVVVGDLSGTDVTQLVVDLASTIGGATGDSAPDFIRLAGSTGIDTVTVSAAAGTATVTGLVASAAINQIESGDRLQIAAGAGADVVNASAVGAGTLSLELVGDAGNDNLTGSAGIDLILGGDNNDTLTGGPGNDQLLGGAGNDTMVWNPGDGSDRMDGEADSDSVTVNGGDGSELYSIVAASGRISFNRVDPAPFVLDIGTTEALVLFAGDGGDTVLTSAGIGALIALTVDGGLGNDTIHSGDGADVLIGNDGDDFVDGNQGNDIVFLGAGVDVFRWDPGDGNDTVEGQADLDTLNFNGDVADEAFILEANGGRTRLTRNVGAIAMDMNDVEQFTVNAGAGIDSVSVADLTGTDVTQVTVNLAGTIGGSATDAQLDTVVVNGTGGADTVDMLGIGTFYSVLGLPALVAVNQSDATDQIIIQGLGGNDSLSASALPAGVTSVTLDGGDGDDALSGGAGADILIGGNNNDLVDGNFGADTALLGAGNDVFKWDPGDASDVVEGQAGADQLLFNGSNASEVIFISPNGGRATFQRDVAAVLMDIDDVETITFNAIGGSDTITINNMAGTDVTRVVVNLAASGGGGDAQTDTITVNGSALGDILDVSTTAPGIVTVTGLSAVIEIRNFESRDQLVLVTGGGNDVIDASGLDAGIALVVDSGAGDDTVTGGDGSDVVRLGLGNNSYFPSAGLDVVSSDGGHISIFG